MLSHPPGIEAFLIPSVHCHPNQKVMQTLPSLIDQGQCIPDDLGFEKFPFDLQ